MNGWQNNPFNERVYNEFPHTFSLEDIDGVISCYNGKKARLILYEVKRKNEQVKAPQLRLLCLLKRVIDWSQFDDKSGVYIIRAKDDNFDLCELCNIYQDTKEKKFKIVPIKDMYFRDFYEFFCDKKLDIVRQIRFN